MKTTGAKSEDAISRRVGILYGILAVIAWSGFLIFTRVGTKSGLQSSDILLIRFVTAALILLPWIIHKCPPTLRRERWHHGLALAVTGGLLFVGANVLGYRFAPLAHGAVIQPSTIPIASIAFATVFLKQYLPLQRLLGVALIILGIAFVAFDQNSVPVPFTWIGDLLFICAGLSWVAFTVLLNRWQTSGVEAAATVSVISAIILLPAVAVFGSFERLLSLTVIEIGTQIIVQGLLAGVISVVAYGRAVKYLGVAQASLFPALVPAFTLLTGAPITGEFPRIGEATGAAIATFGLMVALGRGRTKGGCQTNSI